MNKQTIEGNKLIAEFMGAEFGKTPYERGEQDVLKYIEVTHGLQVHPWSKLEYNSNWSWLMPVVDKIYKMGNQICINYYTASGVIECMIYHLGINDPTIQSQSGDSIKSVWQAVIDFIQWYNTKPKNNL